MVTPYKKPLPLPAHESGPFWEGSKKHRLMIQKCAACETHRFPPSVTCAKCGETNSSWVKSSGRGKVFSFVTFYRLYHKGWEGGLPYVVAVIELEEGARILSNVIDIPVEKVVCDMPVKVVFEDVTENVTLPKFSPL